MRGKRQLAAVDPVVAESVHALVVKLDRPRLRRDELEAPQQTRREPRMAAYGRPFGAVERFRLAQDGRVDRDLAEVVEPPGPAQPVDVREGKPEPTRELVDVACDSNRVAVRRGVALVDDVGEGLERAKGVAL